MASVFCHLTFRASRAELTETVLGVSVDQLTGDRESNSIRHAFYCLHWRRSSRFPKQQVIVYPKIMKIYLFLQSRQGLVS